MNKLSVNELMVRYGFLLDEEGRCIDLNERNQQHYQDVLIALSAQSILMTDTMAEVEFTTILEKLFESTGELLFNPDGLPLHTLDLYVRGLVMQLNRLGYQTTISCDGHEKRKAHIYFKTIQDAKNASYLFDFIGLPHTYRYIQVDLNVPRTELPVFASSLAKISYKQGRLIVEQRNPLMKKEKYFGLLHQALSIQGESYEEEEIREWVIEEITPYIDHLEIDHYGNIVAEKKMGNGPVVLLNAHLDTVSDFVQGRTILKDGSIWSSSEGILGADDRAGVTVLLAIAKTLEKLNFRGTVKFLFTVEEEVGLVGARHVAKSFLWNVDMAFVVDRRGTGDIVTSCGGYIPFCSEIFARRVKGIAGYLHQNRWQSVAGGSSDTRIWAEQGINSINLSAGYENEHTWDETLNVDANYGTYELVATLIEESRSLKSSIDHHRRRNEVADSKLA